MDANSLQGVSGIVTGAASGIGAAISRDLVARGSQVVAADFARDRLDAFVAELAAGPGAAVAATADVRQLADLEALRDLCQARFGRIDFTIANAGLVDSSSMSEGDPERWRALIETNLLGVAYTIRSVLPTMLAQKDGHIVLIASVSGREAYAGEPIYAATKWGVVGLGHALRKETVGTGVRVTMIEPGMVNTPLTQANPFAQEWMKHAAPIADVDIARAVAFVLAQPKHMAINELTLRPIEQVI